LSCSLEKAIGDALRFLPGVVAGPVFILAVARDLGLDLKDIGLNGGGTTHAPQQRCKPEHRLALHRSSSLVIRDDRRFECLIVFVPSRATTTVSAVNRCPLRATTNPSGWCSLVMNMSAVATPNHDLWRVRNITYNSRVRPFNSRLNARN